MGDLGRVKITSTEAKGRMARGNWAIVWSSPFLPLAELTRVFGTAITSTNPEQ